jgi:heme A synthase
LSDPDADTTEGDGFLDRVRRVLAHAEEAARCYLALIAAEGRRLARGLMREAVWMVALLGFGLVGLAVLVLGLAAFIESRIGAPGSGQMILGGLMVVIFLVAMVALKVREKP